MSDSEESSSSGDLRDLEEDSDQGDEADSSNPSPPAPAPAPAEPSEEPKAAGEEIDGKDAEGKEEEEAEPPLPTTGLLQEYDTVWQEFDIVVVHGIRETSWNDGSWTANSGYKQSTYWISSSLGFNGGRFLHFHYEFKNPSDDRADVLYYGGIEREAQRLIDDLLKIRQQHDMQTVESGQEPTPRGIVFVAHDIGGIIVKKALTIAALNPSKYGDIPYHTTNLVFLGCPHRSTKVDLEDQVARMLLLTENTFQDWIMEAIHGLVRTIHCVNEEFLDTKVLLHASVFNIVNRGVGEGFGMALPWKVLQCYYVLPYEYSKETSIPHLELANGDAAAEYDWDKFTDSIRTKLGVFPYYITPLSSVAQIQKTFLSMSPPALPPISQDFGWQPYSFDRWICDTVQYQDWQKQRALSILHIRGASQMRLRSDKFWQWILYDVEDEAIQRNIAYFAFNRNDARFNTVERLLSFMIASIVGRNQSLDAIRPIYDMIRNQRAWTTKDLVQTFLACHDSPEIRPMTFMIACLEECDESVFLPLKLFAGLSSMSEKPFKFILTSTTGVNERLDKELASWPTVDLEEYPKTGEEWPNSYEGRYSFDLGRLKEKKPVYAHLEGQLKEWLAQFGPEDRLGDFIVRWLVNGKQDSSRSGVKKTLAALATPTFESFLEVIFATFGPREKRARDLLTWTTFAFEPLTTFELGIGVELSQDATEEDVEDIFFDDIQDDIRQFSLLFAYREHDIKFWHVFSGMRKPPTPDEAAAAHGELARLCLRYLSFPQVIQKAKEMCGCYISLDLDQPPPMRPRNDLISYAVLYWPQHYALATGSNRPKEEAVAFLKNEASRIAWWSTRYVLSNHMVRWNRGYLSPLPIAAMTGLDDLVEALLQDEEKSSFSANVGMALVEAVRAGHASTAKLLLKASKPGKDDLRDAISAAASQGDSATLKGLIALGLEVDGFLWPAGLFPRIAWLGFGDSAKLLLDGGVKIPASNNTLETSPLHCAIQARHRSMVSLLLNAKCDAEGLDENGHPALARAASQGCPDIVKLLLAAGANTETETSVGLKPVQLAVRYARPLALRALLEGGANTEVGFDRPVDPDSDSNDDRTNAKPLPLAAMNGYTECVRTLLEHGADVKALLDGKTALWHAAYNGYIEIARLLLDKDADPNENPEDADPILVAVIGSSLDSSVVMELTKLLIEHGARVDQQDVAGTWRSNPLSRAAGQNNVELVQFLLDKGSSPNIGAGLTEIPLYVAAYDGNEEILKLLLKHGADVNIMGSWDWTPLHASYDHADIVQALLEGGADIDKQSQNGTVTYLASKHNQEDTLRVLLAHDPKPNLELELVYRDDSDLGLEEAEDGMTPLCIACKNGHVNIIKLLLENGAKADHRTKDGSFPLEFALATTGDDPAAVMEALLEFRPNLKMEDNHRNTVLHNINSQTDVAVVKMLYTAGANINSLNKDGKSPLALAVEASNSAVAKFLIEKNATVDIYSPETGTILNTIVENGQWEVFEVAVKAGANIHLAHENGYKETLLHTAMVGYWDDDRTKIVHYLLETAKVDPNQRCNDDLYCYPLIKCASLQNNDAIQLLLDNRADPNVADNQGRRAVHMAAYRYWDLMEPLLAKGAEAMPRAKSGMTPLHFSAASASYFTEFYENLQKYFKKQNEGDSDADSSAQGQDTKPTPKKELKVKTNGVHPDVDVNDTDADGWTPLMWMAKGNYSAYDTIEKFVEAGADVWWTAPVLDIFGGDREWSPLKAARYYGSSEATYEALTPKEKTRVKPDGTREVWDDDRHATRAGVYLPGWTCDHCLMNIVGLNWKCRECLFNLCYKCARTRKLVHPGHELEPEGPEFEPLPDATPEASESPAEDAPTPMVGGARRADLDEDSEEDEIDSDSDSDPDSD